MPTLMQIGRYRFFFYSNENKEPAHVHIRAGDAEAKFWLDTLQAATNHGFRGRELNEIERMVSEHQETFREAWNDYFGD